MAIKQKKRGFALLVAVVFMSVMLAFGLALASLAYKQQVIASSAIQSQYAFYAADAALECALYYDQQEQTFDYDNYAIYLDPQNGFPTIQCGGGQSQVGSGPGGNDYDENQWISSTQLSLDSNTRCADITVYKASPGSGFTNYIFSQGYDVPCSVVNDPGGARFVARGISIYY